MKKTRIPLNLQTLQSVTRGRGRPRKDTSSLDLPEDTSEKELYGHPRFYGLLEEIKELHSKKNHDYAQDGHPLSNLKMCEEFGVPAWKGTLVRMSDKWSRIVELSKKEAEVSSESMKDTLLDLAVYALIDIILLEEQT